MNITIFVYNNQNFENNNSMYLFNFTLISMNF